MSSTAAFLAACGLHRLVRDLKEVLRCPLPDVVCSPSESDIFVWHGNVRSHEGYLNGATIHFLLVFPQSYPSQPPECRLFQAVPHPNVRSATNAVTVHGRSVPREARWRLALWDCVPDTSTWSGAYTVHSILLQLQAFLLIEDMADYAPGATVTATSVTASAHAFACPHCAHKPGAEHPAFLTAEGIAAATAAARQAKTLVCKPVVPARSEEAALQLLQHQQPRAATTTPTKSVPVGGKATSPAVAPAAPAAPAAGIKAGAAAAGAGAGGSNGTAAGAGAAGSKGKAAAADEWTVVGGNNKKAAGKPGKLGSSGQAHPALPAAAAASAETWHANNKFGMLLQKSAVKLGTGAASSKAAGAGAAPAAPATPAAVPALMVASGVAVAAGGGASRQSVLTKTAKKNLARKLKRQQQDAGTPAASATAPATPSSSTSPPATPPPATPPSATPSPLAPKSVNSSITASSEQQSTSDSDGEDEWTSAPTKQRPHTSTTTTTTPATASGGQTLKQQIAALTTRTQADLIRNVLSEWTHELDSYEQLASGTAAARKTLAAATPVADGQGDVLLGLQQPMGLFGVLSRDNLLAVLCLLRPADVAALSCSCKGLRAAGRDGALWQALVRSHYPAAQVAASCMGDWKHAYMLEANNVLDDLKCFYTRASFEEDVLCLPLNFTVNPKTSAVDYIEAHPEFIALSATEAGVDKTSSQEPIKAVLPLYITADHFTRAQPHYARVLRALSPTAIPPGGATPPPSAWLDVLPKILNTAVVLLCDHGHAASHKALAVYTAVHRLLLAMCERHNLWPEIRRRLDAFLASPAMRSKQECPNLGLLMPLLSLSRTHAWQQLAVPLLEETLARGVMWMCKAKPSLEKNFTAPRKSGEDVDEELLRDSWEAARVSTRLTMFHLAFLKMVGAPPGCSLETVMDGADALYGHPGDALGTRFLRAMNRVMQVSSWQEYYCLLGLPAMTDAKLTTLLRAAWTNSCKRGYTRPGMDFSRIQQSGVSKILLKGQSYTAPPGMKRIELKDCWSWKPSTGRRFLDATILLYGAHPDGTTRCFLEAVDYSHRRSQTTATAGAVTHSGDMMEASSGTHMVQIDLKALGPDVAEMFVVVSAWAGATLSEIVQPFVQVCDPATGMSLCEYHLGDQSAQVLSSNTSVIMARVYKEAGTGGGGGGAVASWKVQALGVVGRGQADRYEPIQAAIAAGQW